jgi:hypothetical protein
VAVQIGLGDQIYADEVSMVLLPVPNEVGEELLGRSETLPVAEGRRDDGE